MIRIAASVAVWALLASPARSAPTCGDFQKYVNGRDQPFASNRGERIDDQLKWKARTPIPGGDCTVAYSELPRGFTIACSFDKGAANAVMRSSYQSLIGLVQDCLNGMDSRDDWRKREMSNTDSYDGRVVTQTVWTWTMIPYRLERKIIVSSNSGGDAPAENILEVSWQEWSSQR
ncbi:hypothetical protein JQ543_25245 [Bradyrhizobium diazoefficiens]|nr:hypothetical protein [Bradyrhizobium diazoefficiens]MBR0851074.1 hypothetical protein [Bradyrhizobium diazoefficiens]